MNVVEFKISSNEIYYMDLDNETYWPKRYPTIIKNKAWPELVKFVKDKLQKLEEAFQHEKEKYYQ
jgi:hypothetical protein